MRGLSSGADADDMPDLTPELQPIARAMALLWTFRTRAAILNLARKLGYRSVRGDPLKLQEATAAIARLLEQGVAQESPEREGLVRLGDRLRAPLYAELLAATMALDLQRALHDVEGFRPDDNLEAWRLRDPASTVAVFRLAVFSGTPAERLDDMAAAFARCMDRDGVIEEAVFAAFDPALAGRIDPSWRQTLVAEAATRLCRDWRPAALPVLDWALRLPAEAWPEAQRLALAEVAVHQGNGERARALLRELDSGSADALRACLLVQAGMHAEAQAAFEAALRRRQGEASARRRLLPASVAWYYPLALLAQGSPALLGPALRFCAGEAGPDPGEGWGLWVHAIAVRLGEATLDPGAFSPRPAASLDELWRLLLAAWLGGEADPGGRRDGSAPGLRAALAACRFAWLAGQAEAAQAARPGPAGERSLLAGSGEPWRQVLASLRALADEAGDAQEAATRLLWAIRIGPEGEPLEVEPLEQKQGPRGWGTPHPASLARLAGDESLAPQDARVARAIRPDREQPRRLRIDPATAIAALVGHPGVVLAEAPEQPIELIEAQPEIEAVRAGEGFVVRLRPALPAAADPPSGMRLIRESPLRVRLLRFSPAQRRAARLIGEGLELPASARAELQETLRALAGHFQVAGEQARGARELPPDPRLLAELSAVGDRLLLRLVVAPLGQGGPRLAPARGRARLMAAVDGETLATRRDLAAEGEILAAVLDAFAFLAEPEPDAASCEWLIEDPEAALELLERLPAIPGIASLVWPRGQPVRVRRLERGSLRVSVSGGREGFLLEGLAAPPEGADVGLSELLAAARGDSRFVPMGEGVYLALTRELKRWLADLEALGEADGKGLRLPRNAGAWLEDALEGMAVEADAVARADMGRLRRSEEEAAEPPRELRASLRPYQEDGFRWAMRLAAAGYGGCLADDMGLGKTLQAIAVLLARAAGGPALILAPTSVAGNWRSEIERFAPGLEVGMYGEGERRETLAASGPGRVVIASYGLFALAEERFAAVRWHTLVADEAQAIKNAEARRSQAAFGLEADFRLALTGTPIENRLADLWSIMRFTNPGLLGSRERFARRFASPIEKERDRGAQRTLRRLIGPFILRRTKAQVLPELPPRSETLLRVEPGAAEAEHYEALRREAVEAAGRALADDRERARIHILAQLTRLRRVACDPRLATPEFPEPGAKLRAFSDLAAGLSGSGHKALVFSQFVDFLHLLQAPLDAAGIPYPYLDGSTPAAERSRRIAAFQAGEGDIFLISLKAGGFGLNLTAADYVVITDPWWNPAAEEQAMGRAHRLGQRRPVTAYRLLTRNTVEERIVRLHGEKLALAEGLLSEVGGAPLRCGDDLAALITETMGEERSEG